MVVLPVSCEGFPIPYFKWSSIPRWKGSSTRKVNDIICLYRFSATKRWGWGEKKIPSPSCTFYLSSCVHCQWSCALEWSGMVWPLKAVGREEESGCLPLWLGRSVLHSSHFLHAWLKLKEKNNLGSSSGNHTDVNWMQYWFYFCLYVTTSCDLKDSLQHRQRH